MVTDEMIASLPELPYTVDLSSDKWSAKTLEDALLRADTEVYRTMIPRYPNDIFIRDSLGTIVARKPWLGSSAKASSDYYGEWVFIKKEGTIMKYVCPCGYVYDPAVGDPDNGVAPGTAWEDVPADWVCPVCGLDKDAFEEE